MKKFFVIFLEIVICNLLFISPANALSWSDIFPPLKMSPDSKYGNPPTVDLKTVGPQGVSNNTYINKLQNYIECKSGLTVSGSWSAPSEPVYDQNGKQVGTKPKYPYPANNLSAVKTWDKLSNNYNRFIGAYTNRGVTNTNIDDATTTFKEMGTNGYGYLSKIYGIDQKHCLQGQAMEETLKSLNGDDTNYADIQRAWDCNGKFMAMDGKNYSTSCRPVTIGEIAYYYSKNSSLYKTDPILFSDCEKLTPKSLPNLSDYPATYKKQYKKDINFLSTADYQTLREDLPVKALGPSNQKVTLTNYNSVDKQAPDFKPGNEITETKDKVVPFGASGDPSLPNQISSVTSSGDFAKPFSCDDILIAGPASQDSPTTLTFNAFVKGLVKNVNDTPTFSFKFNNPVSTKIEKNTIDAATNITNNFANLIPDGPALQALKDTPSSSKVDSDSPLDPGYQAQAANLILARYLYPQSWQDKLPF